MFLKWVYSHIDKAFYVGTANKAYFKKFGLQEKNLVFAPHAVDNERFDTNLSAEATALRASFFMQDTETLVLFAGKFEANKNPTLLLSAFLKLDFPNVHLLFVGNGHLEKQLKSIVDSSIDTSVRAKDNVHFLDFQNQTHMPVVYQASDLVCLPSQSETWGLVINEAMASEKAVLVSDKCGCAPDLVVNAKNGYTFKCNNLENLIAKLTLLLDKKTNLREMGKQSKRLINKWSIEEQSRSILNELNKDERN